MSYWRTCCGILVFFGLIINQPLLDVSWQRHWNKAWMVHSHNCWPWGYEHTSQMEHSTMERECIWRGFWKSQSARKYEDPVSSFLPASPWICSGQSIPLEVWFDNCSWPVLSFQDGHLPLRLLRRPSCQAITGVHNSSPPACGIRSTLPFVFKGILVKSENFGF